MRRTALTTTALALGLTAMLATAAPAGAAGPEVPVKGQATFCLSQAATTKLTSMGVVLTAIAPATLDTTGPTPCVTTPVSKGAISLDLVSGGAPLDGGFSFTKPADQTRLDFTNLYSNLTRRTITADAAVDGAAPANLDLATYDVSTDKVKVGLTGVDAVGVDANLTQFGADAFISAFEDQPVDTGKPLFAITGHVDLLQSVAALPVGLTG
ncbi:hypothetical protein [Kitasatospora sp. MAP5-34]|uniref:hypothetical protein n=1 Tax=Kitasatospora sp. MAP5-34 TaxID=3035102 RepID=UPI002476879D|nr:hypothetical protein [Kitasatospora sp. MAP5-34]MDH6578015.1 hypothetical protein [Kitasatospora sp. MAP5-34]